MAKGGIVIGALKFVLGLDGLAFAKGADAAEKDLKRLQKSFEQRGKSMQEIGSKLSLAVTAPLAGIAAASIKGAQDQRQALAQVEAALTSMGNASGRTKEQLLAASDALEMRSLADGDEILRKVTANLLTFGNVSGAVFDRAQQVTLDLAQRMGGDLQGAALQVGKALNDPVKGLNALSRVGIQFSADQKETIKALVATGETAKAQGIILGELERQFGGAAAAAANTDPWRQAQVAIGQAGDTIGEALLPVIPPIAEAIATIARAFGALPPSVQTGVIVFGGLAAALGPVLIGIGAITTAVGSLIPALGALGLGVAGVTAAEGAATIATVGLGAAIGAALAPLAAIAGAVALAVAAFNHWDDIKAVTGRVVGYVRDMVTGIKNELTGRLDRELGALKARITSVGDWFYNLYDRVVGHSYVPDMVDEIGDEFARLDKLMVAPAEIGTMKVSDAFKDLYERVTIKSLGEDAAATADRILHANDNIAGSFAFIARDVAGSIGQLGRDIKNGGFFEVTESLLDVFLQLGRTGLFGKTLQTNLNTPSFGGFRAAGGPVSAGKTYVVGERGPELFTAPRNGMVTANENIGGWSRMEIVPSPFFEVAIDGRIQRAAPGIAQAGGVIGSQGAQSALAKRQMRRVG